MLTGGRALSKHEWLSLLGKGVIAVQEAFERNVNDRALSWSEILPSSNGKGKR